MMGHHLLVTVTSSFLKAGGRGHERCRRRGSVSIFSAPVSGAGRSAEVLLWGSQERSLPRPAVPCRGCGLSCCLPASGHPCFPWSYLPQGRRLECGLSSLQLVIRDTTLWASEEAVRQWDPTLRESPSVGDGFQVSGRVLMLLTG